MAWGSVPREGVGAKKFGVAFEARETNWERKKPINIKNFGGTPRGVRPVCPGDTSHLSRGHSVPLVLIYT